MYKPKVLVTSVDIQDQILDILREKCEVVVCPEVPFPSRKNIMERIKGVDAVFWLSPHRLDTEILDAAGPSLKVVSTMSAGYDHIDVSSLNARGVKFGNTPGVSSAAVAEIAVTLALMAGRRLPEGRRKILNGEWGKENLFWLFGQELRGATVGIVGFGCIGNAIAKRVSAFEIARLLYSGSRMKPEAQQFGGLYVSFDELLNESDFIFLSCPLNDQTRNLFNTEAFYKMKRNAILINVSRGGVVDQKALVHALQSKQIFAAALDVTDPEPLPTDHPLLQPQNCIVIPHLGSSTEKTRLAMAELAAQNILAALEGKKMPASM